MRKTSGAFIALAILAVLNPSLYAAPAVPVASSVSSPSAGRIGIVAAVRGSVQVSSQGQVGKIVGSGQPIFLGDEISTDSEGSLQILLMDQTVFTIGPNSAMVIDRFVFDPDTHDGEVKARVVKGIFRFVTGKIGQKKPQQMEVALPAGTIGIRGTIVAGEVSGKRSKIVLLGPGEKNNTGNKEGRFVLSNESNGSIKQEMVSKTGFGSVIEGEGIAPTKPFPVPAADLTKLTLALGPVSAPVPPQGPDKNGGMPDGKGQSPTEQSGQGKAVAGEFVNQARSVGRVVQKLNLESNQNAQRVFNDVLQIKDGPTSRNQLQIAAQNLGGIYHFEKTGITMSGIQNGTANFYLDINFGSRQVGGGNSKVSGNFSSNVFEYNLGARPFGFGEENAAFIYTNVPKAAGACASCDFADINVGVDNKGGIIASEAHVNITVKDALINPVVQSTGSAIASREPGAS